MSIDIHNTILFRLSTFISLLLIWPKYLIELIQMIHTLEYIFVLLHQKSGYLCNWIWVYWVHWLTDYIIQTSMQWEKVSLHITEFWFFIHGEIQQIHYDPIDAERNWKFFSQKLHHFLFQACPNSTSKNSLSWINLLNNSTNEHLLLSWGAQ